MDKVKILFGIALIIAVLSIAVGIYWNPANAEQKPVKDAAAASSGQAQDKEFTTIRTTRSLASVGAVELADKLGYYKDAGIVIDYIGTTSGGPENIMNVASGASDFGSAAFSAVLNAVSKGTKIKVVVPSLGTSPQDPDYKWFVLEDSPIRKPADLAGKKIAGNTLGAHVEYVTREYLKNNGMTKDDVQMVVIPLENQEQVLRQRQVDVIAPSGLWVQKIEQTGGVRVLFTDGELLGAMTKTGGFVSTKLIEEKPEVVRKFVEATVKAIEWDKQNRNESRELIAEIIKEKGGNPEIAQLHNGWGIRDPPIITDRDVQFWIDWMTEDGKLKPDQVKPSDVYTNEFNPYYKK